MRFFFDEYISSFWANEKFCNLEIEAVNIRFKILLASHEIRH